MFENEKNISKHWTKDRTARAEVMEKVGIGKIIIEVTVDNGHKDGAAIHQVTNNGIIIIHNAITHKFVTAYIARPGKLKRYFPDGKVPEKLWEIACKHQKDGLMD